MAALVSITGFFIACGDDSSTPSTLPAGGTASGAGGTTAGTGGAAGTAMAGTAGTETAGSFATAGGGSGGTAGSDTAGTGGTTAGTGGTTAGTGGTTAGTGGTAPAIVPTVFLIDNVTLRLKSEAPPEGGAGGGGGMDAGGMGGMADLAGAGGAMGGAGAGTGPAPYYGFKLTFDTDNTPVAANPNGFSPGPGMSGGPVIAPNTLFTHEAALGNPGGAMKISVPFTVATQQADFGASFQDTINMTGLDLTGYELVADVNMTETGDAGTCATAWMYVYGGNGYANDASGEPMSGKTQQLTKGKWTKVRLDLDGPYGFHSTANFKPQLANIWGIQLNTWGCPP